MGLACEEAIWLADRGNLISATEAIGLTPRVESRQRPISRCREAICRRLAAVNEADRHRAANGCVDRNALSRVTTGRPGGNSVAVHGIPARRLAESADICPR
jgi:hypothetical protein